MTTRKEYAVSLGLARPGRGRLSKEAHAAIAEAEANGMTFTDKSNTSYDADPVTVVLDQKVRDLKLMTGYTKEGYAVGFDRCRRCSSHINRCHCQQGVLAPTIVVRMEA